MKYLQDGKVLILEGYQINPNLYVEQAPDNPRKFTVVFKDPQNSQEFQLNQ